MNQIAFAGGAPPLTPLGELTALTRPLSWIIWGMVRERKGRKAVNGTNGRERSTMDEGKGWN